jgi:parvulin-like peptidyl-prolyl isomerase
LRDAILSLEVGELYPHPVQSRYGFHVFKVTDRRNADFQTLKPYVTRALKRKKQTERIAAYHSVLRDQYGLTCHVGALERLLEYVGGDSLMTDSERAMDLFTWRGGRLSIEDYMEGVKDTKPSPRDSTAVRTFGENLALKHIVVTEAHRKGYDRDKGIVSQVEQKRNELIAERLHRVEAVDKVSITDADLQAFYREHQDDFRIPSTVTLQEILVGTEEKANQLIEQIRDGADMAELAQQHSLRADTRERGGRTQALTRDDPQFGPVTRIAFESQVGVLQDPVQVPGGFSIFQVLDRSEERIRPFRAVRRTVEAVVRANARTRAMDHFLESLKEKYASRIKIYEDALELTLQPRSAPEDSVKADTIT